MNHIVNHFMQSTSHSISLHNNTTQHTISDQIRSDHATSTASMVTAGITATAAHASISVWHKQSILFKYLAYQTDRLFKLRWCGVLRQLAVNFAVSSTAIGRISDFKIRCKFKTFGVDLRQMMD
ncbi:hypothetical protein SAMN05421749_102149 [Acinetobacter marinus]|uniref:Uncharacterized protein n=1 Tax=Acinetobacter marinus TaxID=281375 RepID=A0A1G6HE52_9GAMM|nr:hypothetical protein SAMN05421749_102149 [Acinetobacter marinus]